jgi:hypothetical protein
MLHVSALSQAKIRQVNKKSLKERYSEIESKGALTPYPGDLNHCRNCTTASEDGLKESPKHVRQK